MGFAAAYRHEGEDMTDVEWNEDIAEDWEPELGHEPLAVSQRVPLGGQAWTYPALKGNLFPLADLRPHPRNARNGDTDAIVESIRVNGVYRPLYVQTSTHEILAGNHSYEAVQLLGGEKVPVVLLDVDDETALRILVTDNRTADLGMYDDGLLVDLLDELNAQPTGLLGTGYRPDDLADLRLLLDSPLNLDNVGRDYTPGGAGQDWVLVTVRIAPQQVPTWDRLVEEANGDRSVAFARLLNAVHA